MRLRDDIPAGHKFAVDDVATGAQVCKYGQVIGVATGPIRAGEHVHTHNLAFAEVADDYVFGVDVKDAGPATPERAATFDGIVRATDGWQPGTT